MEQNYASGRVSVDYGLSPDASEVTQEVSVADAGIQPENTIEFENSPSRAGAANYLPKVAYRNIPYLRSSLLFSSLGSARPVPGPVGASRSQDSELRAKLMRGDKT